MQKQFFNKVTSVLLALVMVLSLIPMAALGVFATDIDLTADNVVINSVDDWKTVASSGKDFAGQTVILGDNINFGDEAAPVLFATLKGTFLGNGKTVSGKTLAGLSLIATTVDGGTVSGDDAAGSGKVMTIQGFLVDLTATAKPGNVAFVAGFIKKEATVKNITVKNCEIKTTCSDSMGGTDCAILVSSVAANDSADGKYSKIVNCTLDTCKLTVRQQSGLILGSMAGKGYVNIEDCVVTGASSLTTFNAAGGAIIGKINADAHATVKDCTVGKDVSISNTQVGNGWAEGLGMIVGQAGTDTDGDPANGSLEIRNCIANGKITAKGTSTSSLAAAGGVAGTIGLKGKKVVVSGNTADVEIVVSKASSVYAGGLIGSTTADIEITNNNVVANIKTNNAAAGGIVGVYGCTTTRAINISGCNVTGIIYDTSTGGGSPAIGGLLGHGNSKNDTYANNSTGIHTIKNVSIDINIFSGASSVKSAGIVGKWGYSKWDSATSKTLLYNMPVTLNISDCLVKGNFCGRSAGIMNENVALTSKLNVSNVIVAANIGQATYDATTGTVTTTGDNTTITNGKVSVRDCKSGVVYNAENCYTTVLADTTSGFVVINNNLINGLVKKDGDKIADVRDYVNCNLVQIAKMADGKYAVRFIGTSVFDKVSSASMEVVVGTTSFAKGNSTVLDELDAYGNSDTMTKVMSETFGAEKFCAIVIENVPAEALNGVVFSISFIITVGEGDVAEEYDATFTGTIPAEALA